MEILYGVWGAISICCLLSVIVIFFDTVPNGEVRFIIELITFTEHSTVSILIGILLYVLYIIGAISIIPWFYVMVDKGLIVIK